MTTRAVRPSTSTTAARVGSRAASWAVVATLVRAGLIAGLWPVVVGAAGVETQNLMPYLLHLLGSIATVVFVVLHNSVMRLIATAFTGYSTIVLGLGAPGVAGVAIWITGIAALVALLLLALRGRGPAERWAWITGGVLALIACTGMSVLGISS